MNYEEVVSECRREARENGLTFKRSNMNINGNPAYHFEVRLSGRVVLENCTLASAYNNVCSGYVATLGDNS